jgi:hypothetical protein
MSNLPLCRSSARRPLIWVCTRLGTNHYRGELPVSGRLVPGPHSPCGPSPPPLLPIPLLSPPLWRGSGRVCRKASGNFIPRREDLRARKPMEKVGGSWISYGKRRGEEGRKLTEQCRAVWRILTEVPWSTHRRGRSAERGQGRRPSRQPAAATASKRRRGRRGWGGRRRLRRTWRGGPGGLERATADVYHR